MRKIYTDFIKSFLTVTGLLCVGAFNLKAQTTLVTPVPSGLVYYSDTQPGVIVFGVKNTNAAAITITNLACYIEAGFSGNYTLWYHPTNVTGAPAAITAANGWIETLTAAVNPAVTAVTPIFSGLNITIPSNTIYRFALQSPIHAPFYGTAGSTPDLYTYGGVHFYAQANVNSPTYAGPFPGPPANTPRSFYGSFGFVVNPSPVANNASAFIVTAPTNFCAGNQDVKVKLLNNGNNIINNVQVNWEVDGVLQTPVNYTVPIDVFGSTGGNEAIVTLGSINFGAAARNIRVWTSLPNGAADPISADDEVITSLRGKLNGIYTLGGATPDFATFNEMAVALGGGICGPVTINVAAGSGPYTEQVIIPAISGTSAANTVTINGNGATLQFAPTVSADRHLIRLDGTDHLKINNLNITASSGATYGWGIHLLNGANNNAIRNCNINMTAVTSTTQSNSAGIVGSGSTTSVITDGSYSNDTISGNNITGAYQGIIINGTSGGLNAVDNIITNNNIEDFYATGIDLTDNNGSVIANNDINRRGRAAVGTFAGVDLGTGNIKVTVNANRIHDTHNAATTQSGTAYGIFLNACDAVAGNENRITNNLVYNMNSVTGTIYGLYNSGSDGVFFYHNTVVLDNGSSTAGLTRGFYQTTAASNIQVRNNIFDIRRTGTGVKYCVYFGTTTSTIVSNNNLLYNISSAGTNGIGSFGTTGYATLAAWQGANLSAYDQASISLDPEYTALPGANFLPMASLADNKGIGVGVAEDFLAVTRNVVTPDVGAYEFTTSTAGLNMAGDALIAPVASANGCYTSNQTVTIRIRNSSTSLIDFSVNPVTVTTNVTGAAIQSLTATINTGTLAPDSGLNVNMTVPLDMTAPGSYTFNAYTTLAGDVNTGNDAIQPVTRTKVALAGGTAAGSPASFCIIGGTPTLSATNFTGYSGLQWQQSTVPGTGFTNIGGATTTPYVLAGPIAQSMYYRLAATCGANTDFSSEAAVLLNNPLVLTTVPAARCGEGTVTLGATGSAGTTLNWYAASTGGAALGTGTSFNTPSIATTTDFYVSASVGSSGAAGRANPLPASTGFSGNNYGLVFDATQDFTLYSVDVYPTATAGSITIQLLNNAGTIIQTGGPFVIPAGTGSTFGGGATPVTFTLNFNINAGTGYRLISAAHSGNIVRDNPIGTNFSYPIPIGNVGSLTSGWLAGSASTNTYYYFYNLQFSSICESARTAVTATVDCTVPVTLLSFKGEKAGAINKLEWRTATEMNNSGFELQRSADGINFGKLAFIPTRANNGNSTQLIIYSFDDVKPLLTNGYYRLKQIDKDNKASYSQVVLLKGNKVSQLTISSIYPNPVSSQLNLIMSAPMAENVTLIIADLSGKVIQRKALRLSAGDNQVSFNVAGLSTGGYTIKAICGNGCTTLPQKFVKQ
ncbi:MAG: T9SS type A sorting domain-containing protein [Bacteroidota bacterium]